MPELTPELVGQLKRAAAAIITAALIAMNKKLGLDMDATQMALVAGIAVAYISGSNWKAAVVAKAEAASAAAEAPVNTPGAAVAVLNAGPK